MFLPLLRDDEGRPRAAGTTCDIPERLRLLSDMSMALMFAAAALAIRDGSGTASTGLTSRQPGGWLPPSFASLGLFFFDTSSFSASTP